MKQRFDNEVANGVTTFSEKMEYASPEIEVINLDVQPKLLSASRNGSWGDGPTSGGDLED